MMTKSDLIAITNASVNILRTMADIRKQLYETGGMPQETYLGHLYRDISTLETFHKALEVIVEGEQHS